MPAASLRDSNTAEASKASIKAKGIGADSKWDKDEVIGLVEHRRSRDDRGASLVEMALVLPVAIALVLGIFSGGTAYFKKISMADATRDGARYGASLMVAEGNVPAWRQAVKNRVVELSGGQLVAADVCADLIVPSSVTANASCGIGDPAGASSDPTALQPASLVKVSVAKSTRLQFLLFTSNPTLSSKVAARYERDIL